MKRGGEAHHASSNGAGTLPGKRRSRWTYDRPSDNTAIGHVVVWLQVHRNDRGCYIATVTPFGVCGFSSTLDGAVNDALASTTLYLETLDAEGVRERVFQERQVQVYPEPPEQVEMVRPIDLGEFASPQRISELALSS